MIKYRLIVGEVGNEQGHIIPTAARSFNGALIALGRQLALYLGDGWGRIEVNYHNGDPAMWEELCKKQ